MSQLRGAAEDHLRASYPVAEPSQREGSDWIHAQQAVSSSQPDLSTTELRPYKSSVLRQVEQVCVRSRAAELWPRGRGPTTALRGQQLLPCQLPSGMNTERTLTVSMARLSTSHIQRPRKTAWKT